jgi:hypothetical protein
VKLRILIRSVAVWLVIIIAETVHGTTRVIFVEPAIGEARARQIAVFSGMLIILAITYIFIRKIGGVARSQLLAIGALWVVLTLGFEILLGRFALGFSWEQILAEYDLRTGSLMPVGLLFMLLSPLIADRMRRRTE